MMRSRTHALQRIHREFSRVLSPAPRRRPRLTKPSHLGCDSPMSLSDREIVKLRLNHILRFVRACLLDMNLLSMSVLILYIYTSLPASTQIGRIRVPKKDNHILRGLRTVVQYLPAICLIDNAVCIAVGLWLVAGAIVASPCHCRIVAKLSIAAISDLARGDSLVSDGAHQAAQIIFRYAQHLCVFPKLCVCRTFIC